MRICSLLPSATEITYALDLGDQLVAVTHECDFPAEASAKPRITESMIDHARLSSAAIDQHVGGSVGRHGSIYHLKEPMLEELKPDLILTQELCDVCAVSYKDVQRAARILDGNTRIVSLEPNTLDDVLDTISLVGRLTGVSERASAVIANLRQRLERVFQLVHGAERPRTYAMEWLDPPFSGGHWVPGMVGIAGGREVLGKHAAKSERLRPEDVLKADPEMIVLMPCGFSLERTLSEYRRTSMFDGWNDIAAVRNGQVWAVNGSAYFNRPGPRLVSGVEILAEILHPDRCHNLAPAGSYQKAAS